jgi:hypothetical protein
VSGWPEWAQKGSTIEYKAGWGWTAVKIHQRSERTLTVEWIASRGRMRGSSEVGAIFNLHLGSDRENIRQVPMRVEKLVVHEGEASFLVRNGDSLVALHKAYPVFGIEAGELKPGTVVWKAETVMGLEGPPKDKPAPPCFQVALSEQEMPDELRAHAEACFKKWLNEVVS